MYALPSHSKLCNWKKKTFRISNSIAGKITNVNIHSFENEIFGGKFLEEIPMYYVNDFIIYLFTVSLVFV